jgi:hypothetical protein
MILPPGPVEYRKLSVLMPVYNERWTLTAIVRRVLAAPVPLELELVVVDDCSRDGSWDILQALADDDPRIRPVRHQRNRGKGAAIRTAIAHATGDLAVVQDADLEYDPHEFPRLIEPLLAGRADAVFGSRYAGAARLVLPFWHTQINRCLTLASNLTCGLTLTDMETCYKVVRTDILRQLRLSADTFTFEPELTCRLAQWGARIYEVPISYTGRSVLEGKKIRPRDGLKALAALVRTQWLDPRFAHDERLHRAARLAADGRLQRKLLAAVADRLGERVLDLTGSIGGLGRLVQRQAQVVAVEHDGLLAERLALRYGRGDNVRVLHCQSPAHAAAVLAGERFDTLLWAAEESSPEWAAPLPGWWSLLENAATCVTVALRGTCPAGEVERGLHALGCFDFERRRVGWPARAEIVICRRPPAAAQRLAA